MVVRGTSLMVFFRTVDRVDKLLKRKREDNILKRQIFVLLDWGKVQKCSRKLDSVVEIIEVSHFDPFIFCDWRPIATTSIRRSTGRKMLST